MMRFWGIKMPKKMTIPNLM